MILDMVKHVDIVDIQGHVEGFLTDISVISWNFFHILFTGDRSYQ